MQSWLAPQLPGLPGRGPVVHLYDSATGEVRPVHPGDPARMYVCGITPYDATHLGHAATYVAFDLLQRVWLDGGHGVRYVQNVTDVDDPLLERATATGRDWRELGETETQLFREDMTALRVLPPTLLVGAVEALPSIVDLVGSLRDSGAAYEVDGDLYFSVSSDPGFGAVAGLSRPEMLRLSAERGGDPERPGKKDPLDCLLWQAERAGEPAWDSPLGRGRPGWHVECAAISVSRLGTDVHVVGGGSDLAFPHHEMGASEARVATGSRQYARAYVHAGMVGLDGEKMSKSRGNLVLVSGLRRKGADPMAVRLGMLVHHYRSDWFWRPGGLDAAQERLERWREAVRTESGPPADAVLRGVRRHLADDLNAPAALTAVDDWVDETLARGGHEVESPALVRDTVDALLGVHL